MGLDYLKERIFHFTKVIMEDKVLEIAEELEVSNSKKGKKRQATLRKEKKNARAVAYNSAYCL